VEDINMRLQTLRSPEAQRSPARLKRVLIVDDNRDAADALGAALSFLGYDVHSVYDGKAGLVEARFFKPDVAVWDISMPGVDGYAAARELRQSVSGRSIMLVALTALSTPKDVEDAMDAGFDVHLRKPVDFNALLEEIGCA
jgi:CheY-like chemotaxis protein